MNKKRQAQQNGLPTDLPNVLRRRAKDLELPGGLTTQYTSVFLRAADALEAHARFALAGEDAYLEAVADNRRLRSSLSDMCGILRRTEGKHHWSQDKIRRALAAVKPPGTGKLLFAFEVHTGQTRGEIEHAITKVLDATFNDQGVYGGAVGDAQDEGAQGNRDDAGASRGARAADGEADR